MKIFVGLTYALQKMNRDFTIYLGRNKDLTEISVNYTVKAFLAGVKINMFPPFLRPCVIIRIENFYTYYPIQSCGAILLPVQILTEAGQKIPHTCHRRSAREREEVWKRLSWEACQLLGCSPYDSSSSLTDFHPAYVERSRYLAAGRCPRKFKDASGYYTPNHPRPFSSHPYII